MNKKNKTIFIIISLACALALLVGVVLVNDYRVIKLYTTHGYKQVIAKGSTSYLQQKK